MSELDRPPIEITEAVQCWISQLADTAYLASVFYEWLKQYDLPEALRNDLVGRWQDVYLGCDEE